MKKVLFLIRSLNIGGAERQLLTLLQAIDRSSIEPVIVTFYSKGTLLPEFVEQNIPIRSAKKNSRWDVVPFFSRLIRIIRSEKPDVIISYLVAANLLVILLKLFFRPARIAISIRHSYIRKEDYDWLTSFLYLLENKIAGWSDLIIINSFIGAELAKKRGIPPRKMVVIPNGIDIDKFHPDTSARIKSKQVFNLPMDGNVVGNVGRIDPIKDHATFLKAAGIINNYLPETRYLIVGNDENQMEKDLIVLALSQGLEGKVIWLPAQKDLLAVYNAMDICVSSSIGEGFPNVVAEAMACEIPCVVTNVGDSAQIVGESGYVVPSGNAQKMAESIVQMLQLPLEQRRDLGKLARKKIVTQYSVQKMVLSTMQEIEKLG